MPSDSFNPSSSAAARDALERALGGLDLSWSVLGGLVFGAPPDEIAVDFIALHPQRGIALIDAAPGGTIGAADKFRALLGAARIHHRFPGTLPVIHLRLGEESAASVERRMEAAFAKAPAIGVRDPRWVPAVADLLTSEPTSEPHPELEEEEEVEAEPAFRKRLQAELTPGFRVSPTPEAQSGPEPTEEATGETPPSPMQEESAFAFHVPPPRQPRPEAAMPPLHVEAPRQSQAQETPAFRATPPRQIPQAPPSRPQDPPFRISAHPHEAEPALAFARAAEQAQRMHFQAQQQHQRRGRTGALAAAVMLVLAAGVGATALQLSGAGDLFAILGPTDDAQEISLVGAPPSGASPAGNSVAPAQASEPPADATEPSRNSPAAPIVPPSPVPQPAPSKSELPATAPQPERPPETVAAAPEPPPAPKPEPQDAAPTPEPPKVVAEPVPTPKPAPPPPPAATAAKAPEPPRPQTTARTPELPPAAAKPPAAPPQQAASPPSEPTQAATPRRPAPARTQTASRPPQPAPPRGNAASRDETGTAPLRSGGYVSRGGPPLDATELPPLDTGRSSSADEPRTAARPLDAATAAPPRPQWESPRPASPRVTLGTVSSAPAAANAGAASSPECRPYIADTTITGDSRPVSGLACRQPDGRWKLVSERPMQ